MYLKALCARRCTGPNIRRDNACITLLSYLFDELCRELPELDAIVPMPLHPSRLRERGFNQCREIVRRTARRHHLPIRDELLVRTRNTSPQTILTRKARLANLDQTFEAPPDVRGLRILLADDTATTGTSLRKGSEALPAGGSSPGRCCRYRTYRRAWCKLTLYFLMIGGALRSFRKALCREASHGLYMD